MNKVPLSDTEFETFRNNYVLLHFAFENNNTQFIETWNKFSVDLKYLNSYKTGFLQLNPRLWNDIYKKYYTCTIRETNKWCADNLELVSSISKIYVQQPHQKALIKVLDDMDSQNHTSKFSFSMFGLGIILGAIIVQVVKN